MIQRVLDEEKANYCDVLLTKLIQDERQYDDSIDKDFIVKDYFKNIIKINDNILLCYEEDSIIKGYIYLKLINNDDKNGYLIDGLYVLEEYRNQGIAKKLINAALDEINNKNVSFIDINVMSDNKIAINLYKLFGFNEFKITMRKEK